MRASKAVFVDAFGWIALLNQDDEYHSRANMLMQEFGKKRRPLLTTDWVMAEAGNGLARSAARPRFIEAVRSFLKSSNSRLVRVDDRLFQEALLMYERVEDKPWGLVDCASFTLMKQEGIVEAISADRHFRQAGFQCLLSTPKARS